MFFKCFEMLFNLFKQEYQKHKYLLKRSPDTKPTHFTHLYLLENNYSSN